MRGLTWNSFEFTFPKADPPPWKGSVQRWYQLDAYAYGLAEGAWRWRERQQRPGLIILASPEASNETDRSFIESGAESPAKFAHTLPNIRSSPFCQVMEWSGPVLCIQNDPQTQSSGLIEGFELARGQFDRVWILSVLRHKAQYKVHCFDLSNLDSQMTMRKTLGAMDSGLLHDRDFIQWFEEPQSQKSHLVFRDYEIERENFK